MGVRRDVREPVAGHGLRSVAVMVVEVDHQDAPAAGGLIGPGGDRDVIEDTETHAAIGLGVVAGRPHEGEDRLAAGNRDFGRDDGAAGGPKRGRERAGADDDVARREFARPG